MRLVLPPSGSAPPPDPSRSRLLAPPPNANEFPGFDEGHRGGRALKSEVSALNLRPPFSLDSLDAQ
jgi:hypothetical protein